LGNFKRDSEMIKQVTFRITISPSICWEDISYADLTCASSLQQVSWGESWTSGASSQTSRIENTRYLLPLSHIKLR
jgi:hypothetical protein